MKQGFWGLCTPRLWHARFDSWDSHLTSNNRVGYTTSMRHKITAVLVTALLCVVGVVSTGHASTRIGGLQSGTIGYYDYSPNASRDLTAGTETTYWCGDNASHVGDTILEQQNLLSNWSVNVPERTALQEGPSGSWDDKFTCNPSNVIKGIFPNVLGDGVTYTYELFYVGFQFATPAANQIGAAFSTDGLNWHKYPTPVMPYPNMSCGCYGYGQPSATYANGLVTLYFEESNQGASHHMATSVDGVHFSPTASLTGSGLPDESSAADPSGIPYWGSISYNPQNSTWYALFNDGWRKPSTTGNVRETADGGCTLFSTSDPINGSWTELDTIDTNLTGYENNFMCGMVREPDGTLSTAFLPSIKILVSTSYPAPSYNAPTGDIGSTSAFNNWQIFWHQYNPGNPWRPLSRVANGGQHEVTTGWYDSSHYHLESTLGKLAEAPTGNANVPLYGCKLGYTDYFVSTSGSCLGQYKLGLEGYAYATPAADRLPLYRCEVPNVGDFVSTDPNCEGQQVMQLLGYSQS